MVARTSGPNASNDTHGAARPSLPSRLFLAWRRFLARLIAGRPKPTIGPTLASARPALAELGAYLRDPSRSLGDADPGGIARLRMYGIVGLAIGTAGWIVVAVATLTPWPRIVLGAVSLVAWALIRLLVMRLAMRGDPDRERVAAAWGPALVPEVLAVAFPLDLLALGVSAWLTYRGLRGLGASARSARTSVAWAFGGQLAVATGAWAARGGLLVLSARF